MVRFGVAGLCFLLLASTLSVLVAQLADCINGEKDRIGDGLCDDELNKPECEYDGGDCCACTCQDGPVYKCSRELQWECKDPQCEEPLRDKYPDCTANIFVNGDGYCDADNNIPSCEYDGGDCCGSTCEDGRFYDCRFGMKNCSDPAVLGTGYPNCTGNLFIVGDRTCDLENNNPSCGYDGGDCCTCSCLESGDCKSSHSKCLDPSAADEVYACEEPPQAGPRCSAAAQREWVVDNVAQARALADAVNCSGGYFEVEWKGTVVVEKTIYLFGRTILNITGNGSAHIMKGTPNVGLFTVVNASLHVSDVNISDSASVSGGAIALAGSNLTLIRSTFSGNRASGNGGALFLSAGSRVSCYGGSVFSGNSADGGGGVMHVSGGSVVSFHGNTTFESNSAGDDGGAINVLENSTVTFLGISTTFFGNNALRGGGAVSASWDSTVSWIGAITCRKNTAVFGGCVQSNDSSVFFGRETIFDLNSAGNDGGAVAAVGSSVSLEGKTTFSGNVADYFGGALYVFMANVSWTGVATFVDNKAVDGGALMLFEGARLLSLDAETLFARNWAVDSGGVAHLQDSYASWTGNTTFVKNSAGHMAGAVHVSFSSTLEWDGNTTFENNSASFAGGALHAFESSVSWSGDTKFTGNWASRNGGALDILDSNTSWAGETRFACNNASGGGALYAARANLSWAEETEFSGNAADYGGALLISDGVNVSWTGRTLFDSNKAEVNGGALGSKVSDTNDVKDSSILIGGATQFVDNECKANGGALAMLGALVITFGTVDVVFAGNVAHVAGGAVFVSSTGIGPVFRGVSFISNAAQVGGGVFATASGTVSTNEGGEEVPNPTTYDRCAFIGNTANSTGGGIESAAGIDDIINTSFVGNKAGVGGALRLAGTASLDNCSFVDNISDEGGGPAVSNLGFISAISSGYFRNNSFYCQSGEYLYFDTDGGPYASFCSGCNTKCEGCSYGEPLLIPKCGLALQHSKSPGGNVTLEKLIIDPGYWRATIFSLVVLACFNADACLGGVTGAAGYCREGYEGPYCAVCSDGYAASLGFSCTRCSDGKRRVAVAVVLGVFALTGAVAAIIYLVSSPRKGRGESLVDAWKKYVPFQSVKIVIVAWQILTQFASAANVVYPGVYQRFLDAIDIINFDLSWILSVDCLFEIDFHGRLLVSTIVPIITLMLVGITYVISASRLSDSEYYLLRKVRHKHVSVVLLLTFLVYSSVTSTLFQTFACDDLDGRESYLRADYRIRCDSFRHRAMRIYAGFMIVLYTAGIPAFYAYLLFGQRDLLNDAAGREDSLRAHPTSDLWLPYKPHRFYYELVECLRRILLAGVVVFIYPNTVAQVAVTLVMAFAFFGVAEALDPYSSRWDCWISRTGQAIVYMSMYVALLLKADVSNERTASQNVLEAVLVATHICLVSAVVVQSIALACTIRVKENKEPAPKRRRTGHYSWRNQSSLLEYGVEGFEDMSAIGSRQAIHDDASKAQVMGEAKGNEDAIGDSSGRDVSRE